MLCLQEIKCGQDDIDQLWPAQYTVFWNCAEKKGYSGTAIFVKKRPVNVAPHIGIVEHDKEGRVLTAELDDFFVVNVYVPNSKRDLTRLPYRQRWDKDFLAYLKNLEKKKPVIFCGDLNVAHTEIDLANPKSNVHNHGFTPQERAGFRHVHQSRVHRHVPRIRKGRRPLHLVERDDRRAQTEHRLAPGLFPHQRLTAAAAQERVYSQGNRRLGPLPGGH